MITQDEIVALAKRFAANEAGRKYTQSSWDELERYVVPYRGRMFQSETTEGSVEWDKYNHYDDTAVIAAQTLSASMHGSILPRLQWFNLRFKNETLQDNNDFSDWLSDSAKRVYNAIENSNFSLEADEMFIDITGFGHGFQSSESGGDDDQELSFSMIPLKEAFFEEDDDGNPRHFFRKLMWTPTKLVSKFGYENLPDTIQKKYDHATNPDERIPVIFCIFPRDEAKDADTSKSLTPDARPWGHVYFTETGKEKLGEEGGYYEHPIYSVRWRKVSGSQWGHGPGHICLGDIKQLNQHRLMRTRAVEKAIDPANLTTQRGLLSTLDLGPRGLTVVRDMDSLKPYEGRANFQISTEEIMLLRESIKQAFRTDQLELKESPAMTATEAEIRFELMQRLLGPTLGRIKVDWLDKVVYNVFKIEQRAGRLLPMPKGLEEIDPDIDIEYVGAMATAQKSQLSNDMLQWASAMAELANAYPVMKHVVNAEALGREMGRLKSIPEKVINGKDEVKKKVSEEQKLAAQQSMLAQAQAEGEANKAVGEGQAAMNAAQGAMM